MKQFTLTVLVFSCLMAFVPLKAAVISSDRNEIGGGESANNEIPLEENNPSIPQDDTKGPAKNASDYAFATARNAKMTYLYARFIHLATSKELNKLYTQKAILYARQALATSDSALNLLDINNITARTYMNNSMIYTRRTIGILQKIQRSNNMQLWRDLGNQSAIAAGRAVINAYNASLSIPDDSQDVAHVKHEKIDDLHQLPKSLSNIDLKPEKDVLLHESALPDSDEVTESVKALDEEDVLKISLPEETLNDIQKPSSRIIKTKDNKQIYLNLSLLLIALGGIALVSSAASATASVSAISSISNFTGYSEINELIGANSGNLINYDIDGNILESEQLSVNQIVAVNSANKIPHINNYFSKAYQLLPAGGLFIGCVEPLEQRRRRICNKKNSLAASLLLSGDFVLNRLLPKLPLSSQLYTKLTRGRIPAMSLSETLGRLVYNGFRIENTKRVDGIAYFVCSKNGSPAQTRRPSSGLFFKTERIGYKGKRITVYKLRTMRPYAEYLQDYMYETNKLQPGGKFRNDFRVTGWGRFLRALWIDEWPMLINLCKGEVKLVGVRPLSEQFMSLYTEELKEKRMRFKPGLIPPFYADLPSTLEEIMDSEMRYLEAYEKRPLRTDIRYFFNACHNIIFKYARSK